jgi:hypothetical protein
MKKALLAKTKISKDAKDTVQECVSEFINFITGEACDKCRRLRGLHATSQGVPPEVSGVREREDHGGTLQGQS